MVLDNDSDSELPDRAVDEEELEELERSDTPLDLAEDMVVVEVNGW
jgi:hypothetical protein